MQSAKNCFLYCSENGMQETRPTVLGLLKDPLQNKTVQFRIIKLSSTAEVILTLVPNQFQKQKRTNLGS